MKTENQSQKYSKNNAKCSPKTLQNVVQNEWKLYSNAKSIRKIMQNKIKIRYKM